MKKSNLSSMYGREDSNVGSQNASIEEVKPRDPREETLKMIRDMLSEADRGNSS
jgi:hypothetical protein